MTCWRVCSKNIRPPQGLGSLLLPRCTLSPGMYTCMGWRWRKQAACFFCFVFFSPQKIRFMIRIIRSACSIHGGTVYFSQSSQRYTTCTPLSLPHTMSLTCTASAVAWSDVRLHNISLQHHHPNIRMRNIQIDI